MQPRAFTLPPLQAHDDVHLDGGAPGQHHAHRCRAPGSRMRQCPALRPTLRLACWASKRTSATTPHAAAAMAQPSASPQPVVTAFITSAADGAQSRILLLRRSAAVRCAAGGELAAFCRDALTSAQDLPRQVARHLRRHRGGGGARRDAAGARAAGNRGGQETAQRRATLGLTCASRRKRRASRAARCAWCVAAARCAWTTARAHSWCTRCCFPRRRACRR